MKYSTEAEFCKEVTEIILGLFVGTKRGKVIAVPEVAHGYFSNEQIDMLLLDVKNKEYLCVEYKRSGYDKLQYQVQRAHGLNIPCIGVINTHQKTPQGSVFGYTGRDVEIEMLAKGMLYRAGDYRWSSIYSGLGMVYYWAYKHNKSNLDGGITGGGRAGFASVYRQAIRNLLAEHPQLDFMITHATLGSGYSPSVSKKYYRQVLAD